jgi:2-polyprenyl-6-methoxyphenol hydroxylase-like FAD-dependent oxidoreductase
MDIPVLIVGAGPAGLSTSIMLSRLNVPSLLVERHVGTSVHPKATGISLRTMELLRQWGIDHRVREASMDLRFVNSIRMTTLASPTVTEMPLGYPDAEASRLVSPVAPAALPQDMFEPILLDAARSDHDAEIRFNTELMSVRQDDAGVIATIVDRTTTLATQVRARYLIAADGFASPVRRGLGIEMRGSGRLGDYISILFRADLEKFAPAPMCGMYTVRAGDASVILVPSGKGRWVFAAPWKGDVDAMPESRLAELVQNAIGSTDVAVEVLDARAIQIGAEVAERFRDENVFLVGDAAHRTTPSGGMGMNLAIHGAHNLAWKIAAVLNGWAGERLLDSYELEHRPVAERIVARSIGQQREHSALAIDLGAVYTSSAIAGDVYDAKLNIMEPKGPARAGARVPHVMVKSGGWQRSTTDVTGTRMALIAPPQAHAWVRDVSDAARALGIPLEVTLFTPPTTDVQAARLWRETFGIAVERAVLVRPDGHIAWITPAASSNPAALASRVLADILDRTTNVGHAFGTTRMRRAQRRSA